MILIDTNIFLELFLNQDNAEECEIFLNKVSRGDIDAIVTDFT
ncbi:MAG: PIN domain nuclease, partial [Candidatus Nitrosothermus koennekii]